MNYLAKTQINMFRDLSFWEFNFIGKLTDKLINKCSLALLIHLLIA